MKKGCVLENVKAVARVSVSEAAGNVSQGCVGEDRKQPILTAHIVTLRRRRCEMPLLVQMLVHKDRSLTGVSEVRDERWIDEVKRRCRTIPLKKQDAADVEFRQPADGLPIFNAPLGWASEGILGQIRRAIPVEKS